MLKPIDRINIVLVGTTHPGNIGAVARAMKNMGLARLHLVQPRIFPSSEATARAAGADDVLGAATVYDSLDEAVADCVLVIGASARPRAIGCPMLAPREAAAQVAAEGRGQVAIVFGREHSGLSNEELDRCHYQLHIPSDPQFSSLNVAAAAQIVCYELRLACIDASAGTNGDASIDADAGEVIGQQEMERYYAHLETVLTELGFLDPANPRHLMRRLRRLYHRARPDRNEINILRGILTAVQEYGLTLRRRYDQGSAPQVD
ncbi:MAG: RNA methyltransferase [Chromatiales bacterium]|jgi:TrmH family RNA methyltransferase|nr:RNA methyltransferase [Chromatiales bacterium]